MKKTCEVYNVQESTTDSKDFLRDRDEVFRILENAVISKAERMRLLQIFKVAYHDSESSKIYGICSIDSSSVGCEFCAMMVELAKKNPLIICGGCYARKGNFKSTYVKDRHTLNMVIMSSVRFELDELAMLPISTIYCRFNSNGDITNDIMMYNYHGIMISHPFTKFGLWAKNVGPVNRVFRELGKPENCDFIQSSVIVNEPVKNPSPFADHTFTVYLTEEDVQEAIKNGACACNGKKCMECGFKCYACTWPKGTDIAELYRGSEKQRQLLIKLHKEWKEKRNHAA